MHPIQEKLVRLSKVRDLSKLSYREIGRQLTDSDDPTARVHPTNVKYHLDQLISDGLIDASQRPVIRSQRLTANPTDFNLNLVKVPIVGSANCGPATIFADDKIEGYLQVSPLILKTKNYNDLYALRASGDSMNNSQVMGKPIISGDFVIVDSSKITPRDGERVVVVRDNVANIKQIFFDHSEEVIILRSESTKDYNPIFVSPNDEWDGLISGTVIQVIKAASPSSDGE